MLGGILALISALAFGVNSIITRRGMLRVSANYVATITILTGPIFFFIVASITGEIFRLGQYPWQAYVFLIAAGIGHFALGRSWAYRSIQLIGSTRSIVVTSLNPIVTTALALVILKETITLTMTIGIFCTLTGPLLMLSKEQVIPRNGLPETGPSGNQVDRSTLYKGILFGAGAAILWGSSAILIKLGLQYGGSPVAGTFIAFLSASLAILPSSLLNRGYREELFAGDKTSLKLALLSGLTTNIAQLMRFIALGVGSAIVVSLMLRTSPFWVLLFAFTFNRKYESFSLWVLLGNALIVTGTLLILFS